MKICFSRSVGKILERGFVWVLFIIGVWFVVIKPLGPNLALIPGDLGDARFNNYVLEHFYQWLTGGIESYWNAPFFYPFQRVTAFSDDLLGNVLFYVPFRLLGQDRETAFQSWIIIGYVLNYLSAAWVLRKMGFKPVAVGLGAFFFTFGLPVLAQENHIQLLYRFCVPLASFFLFRFYSKPRLKTLSLMSLLVVWQFLISIYVGLFLVMLLAALALFSRQAATADSAWHKLTSLPPSLTIAWGDANQREKGLFMLTAGGLVLALGLSLVPYVRVAGEFGFVRTLGNILPMLPRVQSYLLADNAGLWAGVSARIRGVPMRHEHQLFPGIAASLLILIGVLFGKRLNPYTVARAHGAAALFLMIFTLSVGGVSLYCLICWLPGFNAIRAVSRLFLVLMWPLSVFIAWVVSELFIKKSFWGWGVVFLMLVLMVAESGFYHHATYEKADAQNRIEELRTKLPADVPENPVLYVGWDGQGSFVEKEIDAMLLAQDLGWPTLNGYSGNFPPNYSPPDSCYQLPVRIAAFMVHDEIFDLSYYDDLMDRMVLIDFEDCDPSWWNAVPD